MLRGAARFHLATIRSSLPTMTSDSEPPVLSVFLRDGEARARWDNQEWRCAVGRGGGAEKQREGDGITPVGRWPLRAVLYRPDRTARPVVGFPFQTMPTGTDAAR